MIWLIYILHTHQLMEQIYSACHVAIDGSPAQPQKGDDGRGGFGPRRWAAIRWNVHVQTYGPIHTMLLVIIELFLLRFPQVTPFLRGGISWYATIKSMQFMALPLGSAECGTSRDFIRFGTGFELNKPGFWHGKYLNLSDLVVPRCPSWTGRTLCGRVHSKHGQYLNWTFSSQGWHHSVSFKHWLETFKPMRLKYSENFKSGSGVWKGIQ